MKRFGIGMRAALFVLAIALAIPGSVRAAGCAPGGDGCMPTGEQCATGNYNGIWPGRHLTSVAACLTAAGHTLAYVGGNAHPLILCGTVIVADRPLFSDEPNECDGRYTDLDPLRHSVMLPSDYEQTSERYPVLYLLGGNATDEKSWFMWDPDGLRTLVDSSNVIVVSPCCGDTFYADWRDGAHPYETAFVKALIPLIDSTFRTIGDRAHRAIAGQSAGGYGAVAIAARHPDLFVSVGSFSGPLDIASPHSRALNTAAPWTIYFATHDDPVPTSPIWGDPVVDEVWWHGMNPTDLAINLRGGSITAAVGNGVPDNRDLGSGPSVAQLMAIEAWLHEQNDRFHAALTGESIAHRYVVRNGAHNTFHAVDDLHDWWPFMANAFGNVAPEGFDHRRVEQVFSVWDWTFEADERRATEFLEVRDASVGGLSLIGSGLTAVTTASFFAAGQTVLLTGAAEPSAIADSDGRIRFHVSLGQPHTLRQYTLRQRAAEALARNGYFIERAVAFTAL